MLAPDTPVNEAAFPPRQPPFARPSPAVVTVYRKRDYRVIQGCLAIHHRTRKFLGRYFENIPRLPLLSIQFDDPQGKITGAASPDDLLPVEFREKRIKRTPAKSLLAFRERHACNHWISLWLRPRPANGRGRRKNERSIPSIQTICRNVKRPGRNRAPVRNTFFRNASVYFRTFEESVTFPKSWGR